jgi:hypothetical protein
VSRVDLAASLIGYPYSTRCSATGRCRQGCRPSLLAAHLHVVWPVGVEGLRYLACWSIMPAKQAPQGEAAMGGPQRLTDTEQLEILALLEAASTEDSAMRAARALADLMRHLHALGRRIAVELPDQDRDGKPARR